MDDAARRVVRDGAGLRILLPIATAGAGTVAQGVVRLGSEHGVFDLPAAFEGSLGSLVVSVADVAQYGLMPAGRYDLTAHVGGEDAPGLAIGAAHVRADGRLAVVGISHESALNRIGAVTAWTAQEAAKATRAQARTAFRRLPGPAKGLARSVLGRLRG
jgi:hypothetical protein